MSPLGDPEAARPPKPSEEARARARFPFLSALGVLALGTLAGFGATEGVFERGRDPVEVRSGAWTTWPGIGTARMDPYARAILARTGEVPMPAGEGLLFRARVDDEGRPLRRACRYVVSGPVPSARVWTLAASDETGRTIANAASRYGFASGGLVRRLDGSFEIEVSAEARPGNWLPVPGLGPFVLTLRLYGSALDPVVLAATRLPAIALRGCAVPSR